MQHNVREADAFGRVTKGFSARIDELQCAAGLRISDCATSLVLPELEQFEAKVRSLEHSADDLRRVVTAELQAVPKVKAVLEASSLHQRHLDFIASHLPQYLPGQRAVAVDAENVDPNTAEAPVTARVGRTARAEQESQHKIAPRRYITQAEFGKLSDYMTNRLTLEKVNAGLDDAASLAEANMKLLTAAKNSARMPTSQRQRMQMLLVNVAGKELVRNKCWFMEEDRKQATVLKPDKTGKQILTILRHLKRIDENRMNVKGAMQTVYIIMT